MKFVKPHICGQVGCIRLERDQGRCNEHVSASGSHCEVDILLHLPYVEIPDDGTFPRIQPRGGQCGGHLVGLKTVWWPSVVHPHLFRLRLVIPVAIITANRFYLIYYGYLVRKPGKRKCPIFSSPASNSSEFRRQMLNPGPMPRQLSNTAAPLASSLTTPP